MWDAYERQSSKSGRSAPTSTKYLWETSFRITTRTSLLNSFCLLTMGQNIQPHNNSLQGCCEFTEVCFGHNRKINEDPFFSFSPSLAKTCYEKVKHTKKAKLCWWLTRTQVSPPHNILLQLTSNKMLLHRWHKHMQTRQLLLSVLCISQPEQEKSSWDLYCKSDRHGMYLFAYQSNKKNITAWVNNLWITMSWIWQLLWSAFTRGRTSNAEKICTYYL